jgi:hypothetical protein
LLKKYSDGKLVSSHKQLKDLYLNTFVHRLRQRPIKKDFAYLKHLKEVLCSKRMEYAKARKTEDWTMEKLEKVLKALKKNKSRDPHGFINEIYWLEVMIWKKLRMKSILVTLFL